MNNGKELVKASGGVIAAFGTRDEVRELTDRLKLMLPGGERLGGSQIRALAQGAVAHGLDPFNGEIWMIPGRGLMIGIKGLRRKAREQSQGGFYINFFEIIDPDDRRRWGIPDGALAFEARLYETDNLRSYTETIERLTKAGMPWETVEKIVGVRPYTSGIGYTLAGEPTKMTRIQNAQKRAEADALKRRFDVPFGLAIETENDEPAYAGEWAEAGASAKAEPIDFEQAKRDEEALFGASTIVVPPVVIGQPASAVTDPLVTAQETPESPAPPVVNKPSPEADGLATLPWRGLTQAIPTDTLNLADDAELVKRAKIFISPRKHLEAHLAKHYPETVDGQGVPHWGKMTYAQAMQLWAHLDCLEAGLAMPTDFREAYRIGKEPTEEQADFYRVMAEVAQSGKGGLMMFVGSFAEHDLWQMGRGAFLVSVARMVLEDADTASERFANAVRGLTTDEAEAHAEPAGN